MSGATRIALGICALGIAGLLICVVWDSPAYGEDPLPPVLKD